MENKTVLVTVPFTSQQRSILEHYQPGWQYIYNLQPTQAEIAQAHVILGKIPPSELRYATVLEWMQLDTAGYDPYVQPGILKPDVLLTTAVGAYGTAVSEHLIALFIALQKKIHLYRDNQNKALWKDEGGVNALHGLKVLVIGLGDIGGNFAKKMHLLGNTVYGIRRNMSTKPQYIEQLYTIGSLNQLLPQMDVIALCLPGSIDNQGLISQPQLSLMKKSAILLNGGRGTLIDTEALYQALKTNVIYGAGLDVTNPEPLPPEHPLWALPNVLITPHISGQYHLKETLDNIVGIATENFSHYLKGAPLRNLVKF